MPHPPWSLWYPSIRRNFYAGKTTGDGLNRAVQRNLIHQDEADGIVSDFVSDPQVPVDQPTPITTPEPTP